jgi:hypothetical protein
MLANATASLRAIRPPTTNSTIPTAPLLRPLEVPRIELPGWPCPRAEVSRRVETGTHADHCRLPPLFPTNVDQASLPTGDALSFTRLQEMIGLTPGNPITHLRKLEDAGYLTTEKTGNGPASRTSVALRRGCGRVVVRGPAVPGLASCRPRPRQQVASRSRAGAGAAAGPDGVAVFVKPP